MGVQWLRLHDSAVFVGCIIAAFVDRDCESGAGGGEWSGCRAHSQAARAHDGACRGHLGGVCVEIVQREGRDESSGGNVQWHIEWLTSAKGACIERYRPYCRPMAVLWR